MKDQKNEIALSEVTDVVSQQLKELSNQKTIQKAYAFNTIINRAPSKAWIKQNQGVDYLPIRIVESLLTSVFGMYQTEMVGEPKLIANSVVVSVHLKVYNPVLEQWLTYAGVGAVPVQLKKNSKPMDIDNLISSALQKNVPAAKSFAVSNAAKSIGKLFGSDLGSDEDNTLFDVHQVLKQKVNVVHGSNLYKDLRSNLIDRVVDLQHIIDNYNLDESTEEDFKSIELEATMA